MVQNADHPPDVASPITNVSKNDAASVCDGAPLETARLALHELVEKAWTELDDKIFVCKGYEDMNPETHGQVMKDISRLLEQINDFSHMKSKATAGTSANIDEIAADLDSFQSTLEFVAVTCDAPSLSMQDTD